MIKVTFKNTAELCDFNFVPMIRQKVNFVLCERVVYDKNSHDNFMSMTGKNCIDKSESILCIRMSKNYIDNIQSIEHVKPTDL